MINMQMQSMSNISNNMFRRLYQRNFKKLYINLKVMQMYGKMNKFYIEKM